MKRFLLWLVSFGCTATAAEQVRVTLASPTVVADRLNAGLVAMKLRQATIAKLFQDAGCTTEEQKVSGKHSNVICTLPGEDTAPIVVGGHYDFVSQGTGIVDDWTGTALLPSLLEALKYKPRRHTFVFVAFAEEEVGLVGSHKYVKSLTKEQRKNVRAFVNLECLGTSPPKVWQSRANPMLLKRLGELIQAMGIEVQGIDADRVGDDDSHPFLDSGIPVITLHSITQETLPILHSPRDAVPAVNQDFYYQAYKLAAYYLAYLDAKVD